MAFQEVDNFYHTLLGQSRTRRTPLFLALAYTVLIIISRFMVAPVLMAGLGFQMPIIRAFWLQAVLMLGLFIVPTPGGSGVAELGFAALFSPVVSPSLLGVYTILWRFFTNFLAVAVGGVMVIKFLGFQWVEENKTQPIVEEEMATSK